MKSIVLVAYGASSPEAQKNLELIDQKVIENFPDHEIYWVFTSSFILDKMRKNEVTQIFDRRAEVYSLAEIFDHLKSKQIESTIVQSLHISLGAEFQKIIETDTKGIRVSYGKPLLHDEKSIENILEILSEDFGTEDEITILCGHGNGKLHKFNEQMIKLDKLARSKFKNTFLATLEGEPGTEKAFDDAKKTGLKKVVFVPVMLSANKHIRDIIGDEQTSWKNQLNLTATIKNSLGANPQIIAEFIKRIKTAV